MTISNEVREGIRKGAIIILIVILIVGIFAITACDSIAANSAEASDTSAYEPYRADSGRFVLVEDCGTKHVYKDTDTGAEYLVTNGGGVCLME